MLKLIPTFEETLKLKIMAFKLLKNDTSKKIKDMDVIGFYLSIKDVPKIQDTILIYVL